MSRSGVPYVDEISAPSDDLHFDVPQLLIEPPTPRLPSDAIAVHWFTSRRHLSVGTLPSMHTSQSAPSATFLDDFNQPLSRDRRSQSVPLSLNVVAYSKKLVNISDRFEAKSQAVKIREKERSRTLSESELYGNSHPKRHSDLVEEWMKETSDDFLKKIGSPV